MSFLHIENLHKHFGGIAANDNVNLDIRKGEIHALIGPNGAGKTTLIAQLAGSLVADGGHIHFDGVDITTLSIRERVARGIARSFQIVSLFDTATVHENIVLALQAAHKLYNGLWQPRDQHAELGAAAEALLMRAGLLQQRNTPASELAHGEKRFLEITLALASNPRLLLLDEPMAGLSAEESATMETFITAMATHTTILLVEHDIGAVFRLADRLTVMVAGRTIATGTPQDIRCNAQVQAAYLGENPGEI